MEFPINVPQFEILQDLAFISVVEIQLLYLVTQFHSLEVFLTVACSRIYVQSSTLMPFRVHHQKVAYIITCSETY
jgi:hypothetical protein